MDRRKFLTYLGCGCCGIVLNACSTAPITERRQLKIIPEAKLNAQAAQIYEKIKEKEKMSNDTKTLKEIKKIGRKMEVSIAEYFDKSKIEDPTINFDWEYILIENKKIKNAWCMPGGKIAVYTGILDITKNKNGLAAVMGHEIAHAIANHGRERMSQGMITNGLLASLSLATQNQSALTRDILLQSLGVGTQMGILKFSRKHEGEADRMGLVFMAIAGYNPEAAPKFWKRMAEISNGPEVPEWVSTHPSNERRIEDIKKHLPEALAYYEKK